MLFPSILVGSTIEGIRAYSGGNPSGVLAETSAYSPSVEQSASL